jgi:hypothetical protein
VIGPEKSSEPIRSRLGSDDLVGKKIEMRFYWLIRENKFLVTSIG